MLQDPEKRTRFADSAVTKLMQFGFDGLDFQFQMPGYEKKIIDSERKTKNIRKAVQPCIYIWFILF